MKSLFLAAFFCLCGTSVWAGASPTPTATATATATDTPTATPTATATATGTPYTPTPTPTGTPLAVIYRRGAVIPLDETGKQIVDYINMDTGGDIHTGKIQPINPSESIWIDFSAGSTFLAWFNGTGVGGIVFDMGLVTTQRVWAMPNITGTVAIIETDFDNVYPRFHSAATTHRFFEWPDKDGTVAVLSDIAAIATPTPYPTPTPDVSDTAYNASSWDGVTGIAPSKNATRDKIELLVTAIAAVPTPTPYPTPVYNPGGTDVAVADGGTGSSTASGARTNLGVAIGSNVQAYSAQLTIWAGIALSTDGTFALGTDADVPSTLAVQTYVNVQAAANNGYTDTSVATAAISYRTLMDASASVTATQVAGKYGLYSGEASVLSGTGTAYPLKTIYIAAADYPTLASGGQFPKLRIRAELYTNDVAPTGNFTFGLYPITRPGTSGGAGVAIYTIGTVISGSNGATFTTPVADGLLNAVGSDFSLPSDGYYCLAVVTTATVAASSHVHMNAQLQIHYQ